MIRIYRNASFREEDHPRGEDGKFGSGGGGEKKGEKKKEPRPEKTKTPEFKQWFGKSVVKNKDGEPLVVYHGTAGDFDEFNPDKGFSPTDRLGSWFGVNKEVAKKRAETHKSVKGGESKVLDFHLKIENPLKFSTRADVDAFVAKHMDAKLKPGSDIYEIMREEYKEDPELYKGRDGDIEKYNVDPQARERVNRDILASGDAFSDDLVEYVRETMAGHDGIIIDDDQGEGQVFVAFAPNQIKSATDNKGAFDPKSNKFTNSAPIKVYRARK